MKILEKFVQTTCPPLEDKMADVSVWVKSDQTSSERRINPSWSIASNRHLYNTANHVALKQKLETITGIPPVSQILSLQLSDGETKIPINPTDDKTTLLSAYNTHIRPYITLYVDDSRPESERVIPDSNAEHFTL